MVLSIETIEPQDPGDFEESESVAQFYQDPLEFAAQLVTDEVHYSLTEPLTATFANLGVKGGEVLDLGCGPGTARKALGFGFIFTGVDTAKPMCEEVVERQGYKKAYWGRIEDVVPVLHSRGERFDWCIALSSFYYVKEPLPIIHMLAELCTKGMVFSFDEITDDFKNMLQYELGFSLPMFNHAGLMRAETLPQGWSIEEIWHGHAWDSPRVGLSINAEVVTLIRST